MQYKEVATGGTVYFWFAANLTTGAAGDGATPLYDVRLAGAASSAAPTASGTPTLLSHANYTDGLHEIAIDTTGYATGEYAVFCTLTISTVNPAGFCGSFLVVAASTTSRDYLVAINAKTTNLPSDPADASVVAGLIAAVETKVDTIDDLIDTEIGTLTTELAKVPKSDGTSTWNATALASLQAEATDALNAYDPPTHAEMTAEFATADDAVLAAIAGVSAPTAAAIRAEMDANSTQLAKLGTPAGASMSADIAAVKSDTAAVKLKTDNLPSDPADASVIAGRFDTLDTSVADLPTNAELVTSQAAADDATLAAISSLDGKIDTIDNLLDTEIGALTTELAKVPKSDGTSTWNATALASLQQEATDALNAYDPPTHAEVTAAVAAGDDATLAAIAALNNISTAQVNAEVVDALNVDTYAEPTGVPAATATLVAKIGRLHQALRNRVDVTASKKTFYNDADSALWEKDLSDNATTYSESEGNSI